MSTDLETVQYIAPSKYFLICQGKVLRLFLDVSVKKQVAYDGKFSIMFNCKERVQL
jgi:hypothetical protein